MLTNINEAVRATILHTLMDKGGPAKRTAEIGDECNLLDLGLIDSEDLVEVILEVEERCRCEFNPEAIDIENGLTLKNLVAAFTARRDGDPMNA